MPHWVIMLLIAGAGFSLASLLAISAWGRFARLARGEPSYSLEAGSGSALDQRLAALSAAHPDHTGLVLLEENMPSFAARVAMAREAARSLDLMYYIWKEDLTGSLLLREVIAAADRGVRVRLLLDDIGVEADDRTFRALSSHPQIELRLFNPTRARKGGLRRGLEMMLRAFSVTRRMHNKAMIADGRLVILGGRNIADAYFDASEVSYFRDMDLLALGPVVAQTAQMFDEYWNSEVALPARNLLPRDEREDWLGRLRDRLEALAGSAISARFREAVAGETALPGREGPEIYWCDGVELVADPPEKTLGRKGENWMMQSLYPLLRGAKQSITITSPYFVPGKAGAAEMEAMVAGGIRLRVLTNSLAATDVAMVHGGYARYRRRLVQGGVQLYEMRPALRRGRKRMSFRGKARASLHTKAFTIDGETGFIGSLNFDPRSSSLNTEMGLLFRHQALITRMEQIFTEEISGLYSYELGLNARGGLRWQAAGRDFPREPEAGIWRRAVALACRYLPLESQM
ncbi:phospholipase D family protein [Pseudogemmobacter faecipullorum]|uniref:Phospholipase D n=1 Tax=Pseudogemmobacter faecipullorum TaxID=2755041 RepID=A0ABS8CIZ2_9RHOB|nr:phospholipase D family protein [Pseudogemmobacter faecipullorum]MCB5408815.1 phospholipase D family protein [Pseudogemmobacter faecipullorum]